MNGRHPIGRNALFVQGVVRFHVVELCHERIEKLNRSSVVLSDLVPVLSWLVTHIYWLMQIAAKLLENRLSFYSLPTWSCDLIRCVLNVITNFLSWRSSVSVSRLKNGVNAVLVVATELERGTSRVPFFWNLAERMLSCQILTVMELSQLVQSPVHYLHALSGLFKMSTLHLVSKHCALPAGLLLSFECKSHF